MNDPSRSGPRGLGELLAAGGPLGTLAAAAGQRLELADCVRAGLPGDLAAGIESCNLRPDGTLVVTTASPEWAARLRFEGDAMLTACRSRWPAAARVRVRVATGEQASRAGGRD